eukprot:4544256-Heterocapsa_arctica.AAC.1
MKDTEDDTRNTSKWMFSACNEALSAVQNANMRESGTSRSPKGNHHGYKKGKGEGKGMYEDKGKGKAGYRGLRPSSMTEPRGTVAVGIAISKNGWMCTCAHRDHNMIIIRILIVSA